MSDRIKSYGFPSSDGVPTAMSSDGPNVPDGIIRASEPAPSGPWVLREDLDAAIAVAFEDETWATACLDEGDQDDQDTVAALVDSFVDSVARRLDALTHGRSDG